MVQVELQDSMPVDLDSLTAVEDDSLFFVEKLENRPYEEDPHVQMEITVEMSLDSRVIERTGYTMLDLLSDIGGVQTILLSVFSFLVNFWNYQFLEDYMALNLFKFP